MLTLGIIARIFLIACGALVVLYAPAKLIVTIVEAIGSWVA